MGFSNIIWEWVSHEAEVVYIEGKVNCFLFLIYGFCTITNLYSLSNFSYQQKKLFLLCI